MTPPDLAREPLLDRLQSLLQRDEAVLALAVFGSLIASQTDQWSDLDALLVVNDATLPRFHPSLTWLQPLGEVYTYDQSSGEFSHTTRVCFSSLERLDVVVTTAAALAQIDAWPRVPFWSGCQVVFSRSPLVDRILARTLSPPEPPLISAEQFDAMVNQFRFKAMLAVTKVARDDLLIALHLALDLVRDCCVLEMLLRDRAEGTSHHRHGGIGNDFVARLDIMGSRYTAAGILDMVEQSALQFDAQATQWSSLYVPQRQPLLLAIGAARRDARTARR